MELKYDEIFTYKNLYESYRKCCLSVGWKPSIQRYKNKTTTLVAAIYKKLNKRKYHSKGFYSFDINERGKIRHIKSVNIEERIVQKCLCDYGLIPLITPKLIYDNAACLKGKGYDFSIKRMRRHLTEFYRKNKLEGWILQFDLSKYFETIPHDKLINAISKIIDDKDIIDLYSELVNNFGGDIGLGLGSQISQISAVYYLNPLDHYIKDVLKIKYYGRYMDDGYLISNDKNELFNAYNHIKRIVTSLGLKLNENKTKITKISKGFTFLKARFKILDSGKIKTKPCKKSITKMRHKLITFSNKIKNNEMTIEELMCSYQSWRGYALKFNSFESISNLDKIYEEVILNATGTVSSDN